MEALPKPSKRFVAAGGQSALLRIPPFPGANITSFERLTTLADRSPTLAQCVAMMVERRVGGAFWGAQPALPARYFLIRSGAGTLPPDWLADEHGEALFWPATPARNAHVTECDPWHMLAGATGLLCAPDDDVRPIAAMLDIPTYLDDQRGSRPRPVADAYDIMAAALPVAATFANPFGGDALSLGQVIELCGFWRTLIDSNRDIAGGAGFAFWKQSSVLPLLWNGGSNADFFRDSGPRAVGTAVAVWRSKASSEMLARLEREATPTIEVEDGFLRSAGLGADCIPPLSITVDRLGPYFDPAQSSELEQMIEHDEFDAVLIERARAIRRTIVDAGLGKYGRGAGAIARFDCDRRLILVPGQVEDDRSVMTGGCGLSTNQQLLERVRAREPDAFLIYKPHPDVVAGHRKGIVGDQVSRQLADKVVTDEPISSLIDMVEDVHVNTSLAGFEALMRGKAVTTHGVPFYAGWGLTHDLGPVPARRTRQRSIDELVAATLLLYPRYLDPQSGLPCPAEIVVDRLTRPSAKRVGALVHLRRLQGRMRAQLARWSALEDR